MAPNFPRETHLTLRKYLRFTVEPGHLSIQGFALPTLHSTGCIHKMPASSGSAFIEAGNLHLPVLGRLAVKVLHTQPYFPNGLSSGHFLSSENQ